MPDRGTWHQRVPGRAYTAAALTLAALFLASGLFVYLLSRAADDAVAQNAKRVSIAWAQFFGGNFDNLADRLAPVGPGCWCRAPAAPAVTAWRRGDSSGELSRRVRIARRASAG